jgi:hypothetical protein
MDITKLNLSELQVEILDNDELLEFVGGFDALAGLNVESLREIITKWIMSGDECAGC